jgi:hypothetical protein
MEMNEINLGDTIPPKANQEEKKAYYALCSLLLVKLNRKINS